ncbi:toxin [Candidatus Shapirobacteria bacterium]|nr:toxin [Candidatus Shapirobacteria bacterium]
MFDWSNEKNALLKKTRGVSFEQVVEAIKSNQLITAIKHPNQKKYLNQKILIVEIEEYAYLIPCIETKSKIFLKTIFPSRKFTKIYLEERRK